MRKNNVLNKKGLSLLEVIAVVIISGILLTFGAISVNKIIGSAEDAKDENAAVSLIDACSLYLVENETESSCTLGVLSTEGYVEASGFKDYDQDKTVVEDHDGDGTLDVYLVYADGTDVWSTTGPTSELEAGWRNKNDL